MKISTQAALAAFGLTLLCGTSAVEAQPELILLTDAAAPGGVSAQDVTPDGTGPSSARATAARSVGRRPGEFSS